MTQHVDVRNLTLQETGRLIEWAGKEGWNPSPNDANAFYAADPQGFIGCFVDGELAAGISAVSYSDTFGFIGLYITRPDLRGKGYGLSVWDAGLARLSGKTVGLDGVPAQQANYETMGFRRAYGSRRWSGFLPRTGPKGNIGVAELHERAEIMQFDRIYFPSARLEFLDFWLSSPRTAFVARQDGRVTGYGVMRECLDGLKVGPLFAENASTAIDLFKSCGEAAAGAQVHLDVPDSQADLIDHLRELGFRSGFETARMYLGLPPAVDMTGVFAATTLELG
ncbi:GNAT family N-acetyltransferase [Rhizobium sp. C4]|uniref:GNAT family N-acetyltransferase n=1 Tax=Rhizobium sp. C4 TaxID=1349800 RepID=UPI001E2CBE61|nr:GNAT family N-acetyltransferase [Rhizobium sp. C4]MCD2173536.1 GNAT family N-acetyltransferase [Rhizobium sp. C4]